MGVVDIGQELFGAIGGGQHKDHDQPHYSLLGVAFKPVGRGLALLICHGLKLVERFGPVTGGRLSPAPRPGGLIRIIILKTLKTAAPEFHTAVLNFPAP